MLMIPLILMIACAKPQTAAAEKSITPNAESSRVLIVMNQSSSDSVRIASYYREKRNIPKSNVVMVQTGVEDEMSPEEYKSKIEAPVRKAIAAIPGGVDYIVLTKGLPIRLLNIGGYSVDATLAAMNLKQEPIKLFPAKSGMDEVDVNAAIRRNISPYFQSKEKFSSKKFNMYLVTRLTGYTVQDVYKLINNSLNAKPVPGPILLDSQPLFTPESGYGGMEAILNKAQQLLKAKGYDVMFDTQPEFVSGGAPLMGYASWGSNDAKYDANSYHKIRFLPGAIAETFVSTGGRTFTPTTEGQSLVADLVQQGVTGVKGYVSEPYTFALCHVDVMFDRYWGGYNLAESIYAATPLTKWKDMVIGDPLCRPFKSKKPY
jgi:uncharacterized protein (TIGR03790 family)